MLLVFPHLPFQVCVTCGEEVASFSVSNQKASSGNGGCPSQPTALLMTEEEGEMRARTGVDSGLCHRLWHLEIMPAEEG